MSPEIQKYEKLVAKGQFRQGEILSSVLQVRVTSGTDPRGPDPLSLHKIDHDWAIIVTQDCDLEQDFLVRSKVRGGIDKLLPNLLLCMARDSRTVDFGGSDIRKRVRQNKDERYQFLERVPLALDGVQEGVPELVIDFKQYFTLPTDELYEQVKTKTKRRCRLINEYLAQFANRFANFQSRVALPEEHAIE